MLWVTFVEKSPMQKPRQSDTLQNVKAQVVTSLPTEVGHGIEMGNALPGRQRWLMGLTSFFYHRWVAGNWWFVGCYIMLYILLCYGWWTWHWSCCWHLWERIYFGLAGVTCFSTVAFAFVASDWRKKTLRILCWSSLLLRRWMLSWCMKNIEQEAVFGHGNFLAILELWQAALALSAAQRFLYLSEEHPGVPMCREKIASWAVRPQRSSTDASLASSSTACRAKWARFLPCQPGVTCDKKMSMYMKYHIYIYIVPQYNNTTSIMDNDLSSCTVSLMNQGFCPNADYGAVIFWSWPTDHLNGLQQKKVSEYIIIHESHH